MKLQLKARWLRFWHCLFHLHQPETWWDSYPWIVSEVRCYNCNRKF